MERGEGGPQELKPRWFKRNVPSAGSEEARTVGSGGLGPQKTQGARAAPTGPRWKPQTMAPRGRSRVRTCDPLLVREVLFR